MVYRLKDFFKALETPPEDLKDFLEESKYIIRGKGYGTPEMEMKYLHKIFLLIQKQHPDFKSFSWVQYNAYNDNYHYFKLVDFTVNRNLDVDGNFNFYFYPDENEEISSHLFITNYDMKEEMDFAKKNQLKYDRYGLVDQNDTNKFWECLNKKHENLKIPSLQFLVFIKLLELNLSMYYFLYTFGNGVKVEFCTDGVRITQISDGEYENEPLGNGMNLEDLNH